MSLAISQTSLPPTDLLWVSFNQDHGCFAVGSTSGFRIYNCEPYKETFRRDFPSPNGGIGIVEMLFRCNILALVGGGKSPCFPPTKVMLWDDHQAMCIGELTFKSEVKAVKLRRDKVVVVLENQVYVYSFEKLEQITKFETAPNPKGLVALSPSSSSCVLACPAVQKGVVRVELFSLGKSMLITAHESSLNCLALNLDGSRLATASEKGTLIRVFDTLTGTLLQEVRRGSDRAEIYSISFSHNSQFLCTTSDKGTIHIFGLKSAGSSETSGAKTEVENRKSRMSFLGPVLPQYFNSEWSFAWWRGPELPMITCFGQDNASLIAVTADGSFYKLIFDTVKGGECTQQSYSRFLKPPA